MDAPDGGSSGTDPLDVAEKEKVLIVPEDTDALELGKVDSLGVAVEFIAVVRVFGVEETDTDPEFVATDDEETTVELPYNDVDDGGALGCTPMLSALMISAAYHHRQPACQNNQIQGLPSLPPHTRPPANAPQGP